MRLAEMTRDDCRAAVGLRPPLAVRRSEDWTAIDGYSDSPARGEAVHGSEYLSLSAAALVAAIERMTGER